MIGQYKYRNLVLRPGFNKHRRQISKFHSDAEWTVHMAMHAINDREEERQMFQLHVLSRKMHRYLRRHGMC